VEANEVAQAKSGIGAWLVAAGLTAAWAGVIVSVDAAQAPAPSRSARDGVYTDDQAARGKKTFETICIACHETRLWRDYWVKETLGDLFETIRTNMPEDAPGTLSPQEVRDVLAFILSANRLPAGTEDLSDDVAELRRIRVEPAAP
jgi:mono/diheme cytochrome c family protein